MKSMGWEIEAKMKLVDRAALEQRLVQLGAQRGEQVFETNTFYDTPDRQLKRRDEGLRLRINERREGQSTVIMTHKGPRQQGPLKCRSETELEVSDRGAAGMLLDKLGYQPVLIFEKRRQGWQIDDCFVELDTIPYLGDFVEIEGASEQSIMALRKKLDLQNLPLIRASYSALLCGYAREHGIDSSAIRFT